jgi:NhaP-type Na+/H+ and K+/H+ antiporter
MTWHGLPPRCPRGLTVLAWAKLRGAVPIMIAVPGNFAHPARIGFTESIY